MQIQFYYLLSAQIKWVFAKYVELAKVPSNKSRIKHKAKVASDVCIYIYIYIFDAHVRHTQLESLNVSANDFIINLADSWLFVSATAAAQMPPSAVATYFQFDKFLSITFFFLNWMLVCLAVHLFMSASICSRNGSPGIDGATGWA